MSSSPYSMNISIEEQELYGAFIPVNFAIPQHRTSNKFGKDFGG